VLSHEDLHGFCIRYSGLRAHGETKDTLGKHAMLKSHAQLQDEGHGEEEFPPLVPLVQSDSAAASSLHSLAPASKAMLSCILDTIRSIQRDVTHMSVCIEHVSL
jgi:hypothetical protein